MDGHRVILSSDGKFELDLEDVESLIEMFYAWGDSTFYVDFCGTSKSVRGTHVFDWDKGAHIIVLSKPAIDRSVTEKFRVGGNHALESERIAAGAVFVHELQHANQHGYFRNRDEFFRKPGYENRPCERDARAFVDRHIHLIRSMLRR
jgi:hypothetical protein